MAAGLLLGVMLLVGTTANYLYVAYHLVPRHLEGEATRLLALLEERAQRGAVPGSEQWRALLDEIRREHPGQIAWIRLLDSDGRVLSQSGEAGTGPPAQGGLRALMEKDAPGASETRSTPHGEAMVILRRLGPGLHQNSNARLAEVALYLQGAAAVLRAMQRIFAVSTAAALALVASMVVFALNFRGYLRGRELEQQLALARRVQQDLLPRGCRSCGGFDLAGECVPAWDVGGDYYDVFPVGHRAVTLAVGDVSGKGLPAALLMGLLHGAVRFAAGIWNGQNHAELMAHLNELLWARTSAEQYATLFWAYYDPESHMLRYVNAGHLPPLLVRVDHAGETQVERLDKGGLVIGLLPGASYEQGEVPLSPGDLLVLYSDGLVEAADASGTEFGELRLVRILKTSRHHPAAEIQRLILEQVRTHVGDKPFDDDLTLLVVRIAALGSAPTLAEEFAEPLQVA